MAKPEKIKGQHPHRMVVDEAADVPLFDIEEVPRFVKGDAIIATTIWGEETGQVIRVDLNEGLVVIQAEAGHKFAVTIGRVRLA